MFLETTQLMDDVMYAVLIPEVATYRTGEDPWEHFLVADEAFAEIFVLMIFMLNPINITKAHNFKYNCSYLLRSPMFYTQ